MSLPRVTDPVPHLSVDQMREVDRLMVEEYRIEIPQMMEHAGRHLAHLARERFFEGDVKDRAVVVLAGSGGNGGGALVAARRLHAWGARVRVFVTRLPEKLSPLTRLQLEILPRMAVSVAPAKAIDTVSFTELVLDGIIGYTLHGAANGAAAELIRWANQQPAPVLSLDLPSGIDGTTGEVHDPTVRAAATMTLALPKLGLQEPAAADQVGELYLADIGVPRSLYALPSVGIEVPPIFSASDILRLK
jgi:NAD(P)H-hydrate epimerase